MSNTPILSDLNSTASGPKTDEIYDIAIIGAGPAGLTAAIYACRAGKKTVVFEKLVAGGQIVNTPKISNYPATPGISGAEWSKTLEKQASDLGVEIVYDEVFTLTKITKDTSIFSLKTEDEIYMAKTVIVATGLVERKLEIPGEAEYFGRGVSYCATCDGAFCKGKTVVVVGGGNSALGSALYLSDLAEKVYLVHRRADFRGDFALQEKIKARKNIELVLGYVPTEIIGDGKKATGIKLAKRAELAVMKTAKDEPAEAAQGTDAPVTRELQTDAVFVAIGKTPANQLIKDLVELDGNGYAITDEHCTTKTEGLFVAGDGRAKELHQLVTATADGAIAAHSAIKFLH